MSALSFEMLFASLARNYTFWVHLEMLKNIFSDVKTASRRAPGRPRKGKIARDPPPPPATAATTAISPFVNDVKTTSEKYALRAPFNSCHFALSITGFLNTP